jgi:hypothetical protein
MTGRAFPEFIHQITLLLVMLIEPVCVCVCGVDEEEGRDAGAGQDGRRVDMGGRPTPRGRKRECGERGDAAAEMMKL